MHFYLYTRIHSLIIIRHIYDLYALVFIYTFINNNNTYTYYLYALVFIHGRWKWPEYEDDPTRQTKSVQAVRILCIRLVC